ncbi:MAG: helix-turn-helix transcriptional regulator [Deltaproteobacteria bacterium]
MEISSINHIWKYRKRKRLGQKRIAYLLGHTCPTQFSKWESGKILPNLENALKLAYILDAPVESLFGDLFSDLRKDVDKKELALFGDTKRSKESNKQF